MRKVLISPYLELNKYNKIVLSLNLEWFSYLNKLGFCAMLANPENSIRDQIKNINFIIISGGGDISKIKKNKLNIFRDKFEKKLINEGIKKKIPIIAICRGFQLINHLLNKNIKDIDKVKNHRNKNHYIYFKKNILCKKNKILVNSFHNLQIIKLNDKLKKIAVTKNSNIEIAFSKKKRILGLMFHPERYNKNQIDVDKIIRKFVNLKWD